MFYCQTFMIAETCKIHSTAKISPDAEIGDFCVIGANVVIEPKVKIGNHNHIDSFSKIGRDTQIGHHNVLAHHTIIGENCRLEHFNHLGSDGFGYAQSKSYQSRLIPQRGNVVLENNIHMGSRNCIDRAAFFSTLLKSNGKLTNHCHIAHNCIIESNFFVGHCFVLAGSTHIQKNFIAVSDNAVGGHSEVVENVTLTTKSIINSNQKISGVLGGFPAIPIEVHTDNMQILLELNSLLQNIHEVADES